jgi:hypothetical protein
MRKSSLLTAALLAVALLHFPAHAQDAKKDAAIKPADSPSKVVLDSWNDIGRKLIAMAEDFPRINTTSNQLPFSAVSPNSFYTPLRRTIISPTRFAAKSLRLMTIQSAITSNQKRTSSPS